MVVYMAVSLYFGLPGCGKTTWLTALAVKSIKKNQYKFVFSNVHLNIPGVTYIDNDCIGQYELHDCLLLIDEATLFADSRDYKRFDKSRMEYFLEHRHRNADIVLFTQQWDGVDRKIRVITDRVYYVFKGIFLGHWFSTCWRIPYGILFPDPKKTGDRLGEIIQGYRKPNFLIRLFSPRIFRPKYYKYFDSWELKPLPDLPPKYSSVPASPAVFSDWFHKSYILLRSTRKARKVSTVSRFRRTLPLGRRKTKVLS